jgi:hypothetical protein
LRGDFGRRLRQMPAGKPPGGSPEGLTRLARFKTGEPDVLSSEALGALVRTSPGKGPARQTFFWISLHESSIEIPFRSKHFLCRQCAARLEFTQSETPPGRCTR